METIEAIENYLFYLTAECGLSVSLHPLDRGISELRHYNAHANSYCTYVKASPNGFAHCLAQQKRAFSHCKKHKCGFSGVCYAGVFEYVYPISDEKGIVGFLSVSGYAADQKGEYPQRTARLLGVSEGLLCHAYSALKTEPPEKSRVDTLIFPLCQMLELVYRKRQSKDEPADTLFARILGYVQTHFSADLSVESLCREFSCSRSYFSHTFKRTVGKGFREYLLELRLSHAKHLLARSELNVTEVAFSVGFNDSNYFSSLFRQKVGVSPLAYRKQSQQGK